MIDAQALKGRNGMKNLNFVIVTANAALRLCPTKTEG